MGKKIVLIAVVICLDLAFIMVMRDGNWADLSQSVETQVIGPALTERKTAIRQPATVANQPEQPIGDDKVAMVPRPTNPKKPVLNGATRKDYAPRKALTRPEQFPAYDQAPETYTDTIILYERAGYVRDDEPVAVTAKATKNSNNVNQKKRSFFGRSLPVVKKPYQWIKTLITKL